MRSRSLISLCLLVFFVVALYWVGRGSYSPGRDASFEGSRRLPSGVGGFSLPAQEPQAIRFSGHGGRPLDGARQERRTGPAPDLDKGMELIRAALSSRQPQAKIRALGELAWMPASPEILKTCLTLLEDEEEEVRVQAVLTLESLEDPALLPILRELAKVDPGPAVRSAAAHAAGVLAEVQVAQAGSF